VDAIRTFDDGRIDVIRIGTAATRHGTSDAEFGFDVAKDGVLRLDACIDRCEPGIIDIEPVEVAVEAEGHRAGFVGGQRFDGCQRGQVTVQPADHIQRLGFPDGAAGNGLGAVAITERATPASDVAHRKATAASAGGLPSGACRSTAIGPLPQPIVKALFQGRLDHLEMR
jgi:hypothetical protein